MLLQQRCLVYLHAACACIVTVEPAAAAAFFDSDSCMVYLHGACACIVTVEPAAAAAFLASDCCNQPVVIGILCICN